MMFRITFYIALLALPCIAIAQVKTNTSAPFSLYAFPENNSSINYNSHSNVSYLPATITPITTTPFISDRIKYTAFFCRFENKVDKKLNLRLKLRAGNDDMYRKINTQLK